MPCATRPGGREPQARLDDDPLEPRSPAAGDGARGRIAPGATVPGAVVLPELIVADRRWRALVPGSGRVVARAARLGGGAGSVLLTTDAAVRRLNARHRGRNRATNVLTFEAAPGLAGGDIVLALGVVRREAGASGRPVAHHLAHLVLHGALHLRGHDHHGAGEARRMEMREAWLLHRMGVPNPWRVAGASRGAGARRGDGAAAAGARAMARGSGGAGGVMRGATRRPGLSDMRGGLSFAREGLSVTRGGTEAGAGQGRVPSGVTR